MKIFLAGQQTLANRGCEALVVSTMQAMSEIEPDAHFVIPTTDEKRDRAALEKYDFSNYTFVPAPDITTTIRVWNRLMRYAPSIAKVWVPSKMDWPAETRRELRESDRVLHIGGDNFSYDYSYAGLVSNTAQIDEISTMGKQQEIWCATVGPFDNCPELERQTIAKLKKLDRISVREQESKDYLESRGVAAELFADPAFSLKLQPADAFEPQSSTKRIIVNVSPYVYRNADKQIVRIALTSFVTKRIEEGYHVLFLSHVNTGTSSDSATIRDIFADFLSRGDVSIVPEDLTASQFKSIVAASNFVVAVRTHVTIAGFSSATPTLSIGYSAKAPRLNEFLFGHSNYIVETRDLNTASLETTFQAIARDQDDIRTTLKLKSESLRSAFRQLCESTIRR